MCTQYKFTILAYRTLLIIIVIVIYKDDKFINVVTILNVVRSDDISQNFINKIVKDITHYNLIGKSNLHLLHLFLKHSILKVHHTTIRYHMC